MISFIFGANDNKYVCFWNLLTFIKNNSFLETSQDSFLNLNMVGKKKTRLMCALIKNKFESFVENSVEKNNYKVLVLKITLLPVK